MATVFHMLDMFVCHAVPNIYASTFILLFWFFDVLPMSSP